MLSEQQILQRDNRGSRWREWFMKWHGVPHECLYNRYVEPTIDTKLIKVIFDDEAGPIQRENWMQDKWYVKNISIKDFVVDHEQKNIWMDACTYNWWMAPMPIQNDLPQNNWIYLMGSLKDRYHRYFLYQMARQQNWPVLWSCISTNNKDMKDVELYYQRYKNNWSQDLPSVPYDVFPTTYNNGVSLHWGDKNYDNPMTMIPKNRAWDELNEAWPSYRLHIVAETVTESFAYPGGTGKFITEKSFRALSHGRPSVWLACAGTLSYLRDQGYRTWSEMFDESYDQEKDIGLRFKKLCETLKDINSWSEYKWQSLWPLVVEIAKHNHDNFESHHSRSRINIKKAKKVIFNL